jgi:glucose-1-phosphate cytidylyltransferase
MKYYASFGHRDFVLCLGYKSQLIKDFFLNYEAHTKDFTICLGRQRDITFHTEHAESDWRVTLADTGLDVMTGARIARIKNYIEDENFLITYGDGVGNVPIAKVLEVHKAHGLLATVTAVHPPARFGVIEIEGYRVTHFGEKDHTNVGWINGGFFVLEPEVIEYIHDDNEPFEKYSLPRLVAENQLGSFEHEGFWQPMDTLREKNLLEAVVTESIPPWLKFEN